MRRAVAALVALAAWTAVLGPDTAPAAYLPPLLEQVEPEHHEFADSTDFAPMYNSGVGRARGKVTAVDLTVPSPRPDASTSGCERADFAGFPRGTIALLQRGRCSFRTKATNALRAGATAVIVFNEGNRRRKDLFEGSLFRPVFRLPVVATSFETGEMLRHGVRHGPTGSVVRVQSYARAEPRGNVLLTLVVGALVVALLVWVAVVFRRNRPRGR